MRVSRDTIIKAIKTENLRQGAFVKFYSAGGFCKRVSIDPKCEVCSVGAILRTIGFDNNRIDKYGSGLVSNAEVRFFLSSNSPFKSSKELINKLLKEKKYLNAMSVKYESLTNPKTERAVMVRFVLKHLPKYITI